MASFGHVQHGARHFNGCVSVPPRHPSPLLDDSDSTVGPNHPVLDLIGLILDALLDGVSIVGVDHRKKGLIGRLERVRVNPENAVHLVRPLERSLVHIPDPVAQMSDPLRFLQALAVNVQFAFAVDALGHVLKEGKNNGLPVQIGKPPRNISQAVVPSDAPDGKGAYASGLLIACCLDELLEPLHRLFSQIWRM